MTNELNKVKGSLESIGGFFALGSRDFTNRVNSIIHRFQLTQNEKELQQYKIVIGRSAAELGIQPSDFLTVVEEIRNLESSIGGKEKSRDALQERLEQLGQQRLDHNSLYQTKISEQLNLKRPVDGELTALLVDMKRTRKDINDSKHAIVTLKRKIKLNKQRLTEPVSSKAEARKDYFRDEIKNEMEFNKRSIELKTEKIEFLKSRLKEIAQREEKTRKVIDSYDKQISELRSSQHDGLIQIDETTQQLKFTLRTLDKDINRIKHDMNPLFASLGEELAVRRIEESKLRSEYKFLDELEEKRETHANAIKRCRADSESISLGIKMGFYGMVLVLVIAIVGLLLFLN